MWKYFLKEYLSFTKKERTGIFLLLSLIIFAVIIPFLYPLFKKDKPYNPSQFAKQVSELKMLQADSVGNNYYNKNFDENNQANYYEPSERHYANKGELFYFDPNVAGINDWIRLGVRQKTAETIQKYLLKGGRFYKPEDISKIWGLRKHDVDRLMPYVRIKNEKREYGKANNNIQYERAAYTAPVPVKIEVNSSDTNAFISLPGIGSKLAQRIVTFRDRLGGFYSIDQVKETYGLPDSTFQKIKSRLVLDASIKKININTATVDELKSHPYIKYPLANAIIQYRSQHGNYSSVAEIKKIMIVTDEIFNKAAPYLSVN